MNSRDTTVSAGVRARLVAAHDPWQHFLLNKGTKSEHWNQGGYKNVFGAISKLLVQQSSRFALERAEERPRSSLTRWEMRNKTAKCFSLKKQRWKCFMKLRHLSSWIPKLSTQMQDQTPSTQQFSAGMKPSKMPSVLRPFWSCETNMWRRMLCLKTLCSLQMTPHFSTVGNLQWRLNGNVRRWVPVFRDRVVWAKLHIMRMSLLHVYIGASLKSVYLITSSTPHGWSVRFRRLHGGSRIALGYHLLQSQTAVTLTQRVALSWCWDSN